MPDVPTMTIYLASDDPIVYATMHILLLGLGVIIVLLAIMLVRSHASN